jgi:hypothetical protein
VISSSGLTFFKMTEMFFEDTIDDSKYLGHLYGLGTTWGPEHSTTTSLPFSLTPRTGSFKELKKFNKSRLKFKLNKYRTQV